MLTKTEIKKFKGDAQRLEPVLKIGKNGLTDAFLQSFEEALAAQGLIKIKFVEFKEEKKSLAAEIASRVGCDLITIVGNVAVFYRKQRAA